MAVDPGLTPRVSRSPHTAISDRIRCARSAGWCSGTCTVAVPSSTPSVAVAATASVTNGSGTRKPRPITCGIQRLSNPAPDQPSGPLGDRRTAAQGTGARAWLPDACLRPTRPRAGGGRRARPRSARTSAAHRGRRPRRCSPPSPAAARRSSFLIGTSSRLPLRVCGTAGASTISSGTCRARQPRPQRRHDLLPQRVVQRLPGAGTTNSPSQYPSSGSSIPTTRVSADLRQRSRARRRSRCCPAARPAG